MFANFGNYASRRCVTSSDASTGDAMRSHVSVCVVALVLVGLLTGTPPLHAQSCTADVQCRDGGRSRTYCAGNALVTTRSVCTGSCRMVEESRRPCAGTCAGDRCIDTTGRDRFEGHGETPSPWPRCNAGCRCANKILIVTTGRWSQANGCEQLVRRCARGCTCEDAPRCR